MKLKLYFSNEQKKIKISFRMRHLITKAIKEALKQEEFEYFVQYQMATCERQDLIGAGAHTLDILRKM